MSSMSKLTERIKYKIAYFQAHYNQAKISSMTPPAVEFLLHWFYYIKHMFQKRNRKRFHEKKKYLRDTNIQKQVVVDESAVTGTVQICKV